MGLSTDGMGSPGVNNEKISGGQIDLDICWHHFEKKKKRKKKLNHIYLWNPSDLKEGGRRG